MILGVILACSLPTDVRSCLPLVNTESFYSSMQECRDHVDAVAALVAQQQRATTRGFCIEANFFEAV